MLVSRVGEHGSEARSAHGFYRRLILATALVFLGFVLTGPAALAAPGDLDPTFDGDGKLVANFEDESWSEALALQPGGKAVVGGTACSYVYPDDWTIRRLDCNSLLVRYGAGGALDTGFGENGRAIVDIGSVSALETQTDGKLISVGDGEGGDFALARHEADGAPDVGFGRDGKVVADFGDIAIYARGRDVAVRPDGKIVVAGFSRPGGSGQDRIVLARYESDGSLDTSFGEDGKVVASFASGDATIGDLAVLPDGGLLVSGSGPCGGTSRGFVVARYNAEGSLDTGFGERGEACTVIGEYNDAHAASVDVQPDGRIVAAGRYTLDPNGSDGWARYGLAVARYTADGTPDAAFGNNGTGIASLSGSFRAVDLALQPGGEIAVSGGYSGEDFGGFGLARFEADGTPDKGFGDGGAVSTDFSGDEYPQVYDQVPPALDFQADGKLVAAGYFHPPCGRDSCEHKIALARYDASPSIGGEPTNAAPVAKYDRVTIKKNRRAVFNVLRNDSDPDGDRLTVARHTRSEHGKVRCGGDGRCVYVPDRGYAGRDAFEYVAKDGRGGADTATVRLRIRRG